MLINWFTVAAQIINFLILVALLKRFLYGPIVTAMAAREERIASQLAEARQKRQEAEQEEASLRQKMRKSKNSARRCSPRPNARRRPISRSSLPRPGRKWSRFARNGRSPLNGKRRPFSKTSSSAWLRRSLPSPAGPYRNWRDQELEQRMLEVFLDRLRQLAPEEQAGHPGLPQRGGRASCLSPPRLSSPEETRRRSRPGFRRPVRPGPGPALRHLRGIAGGHRDAHQFPQDRLESGELPGHPGGGSLPGL